MPSKLVLLLLILTLAQTGFSLKCYSCESIKDPHSLCVHPSKDKVKIEDCKDGVCAVYTTKNAATGIKTITRSCSPKDVCLILKLQEAHFGKLKKCETCTTDLCSSGNIRSVAVAALSSYLFLLLCVL